MIYRWASEFQQYVNSFAFVLVRVSINGHKNIAQHSIAKGVVERDELIKSVLG